MPKAAKTKKVVHPNSRAAAQLARKAYRDDKLDRKQKERNTKLESIGEKCWWFREHLDAEKALYSKQEAQELVESYLQRFEEELEQIDIKHGIKGRSGVQHAGRKDAIQMTLQQETTDFHTAGLEIPDIMNGKAITYLREWNGEIRFLPNIKMRRIAKSADGSSKPISSSLSPVDKISGSSESAAAMEHMENDT